MYDRILTCCSGSLMAEHKQSDMYNSCNTRQKMCNS